MTTRSIPRISTRLTARRLFTCAAVTAALAGVTPGIAAAHSASFSSEHSLSLTSGRFAGQLTSALAECVSGRVITLYRAEADGAVAVASTTTTTDTQGAWSQPTDTLRAGDHYAVAAARAVKLAGHKHTCDAARSNTVTLAPDADGDGYTATGGDCADDNPSRHPGATDDTPNGIDDDCDGSIDEDYRGIVVCDAASSGLFDPQTGTWSCVPLLTPDCPVDWDARDAASAEWNAYLAADPTLSDPDRIAALTYPLDAYIACFGF